MSGLKHLFLRILPIITLVCFISFGILHIFPTSQNNPNITYLEKEQINIGTEEEPNYKELYTLDIVSYTQNINQDILKRSITNTLTLQAYQQTLDNFNVIWENGYQIFDVTKTIANATVVLINTLILPLNILLIPLRIISGILLTGMSLVGININNGTIVIPLLTFILDRLTIPFINTQSLNPSHLNQQDWQFKQNINELYQGDQEITVDFKINVNNSNIYDKIRVQRYSGSHVRLQYHIKNTVADSWETVFDSGRTGNPWFNEYQIRSNITILENQGITGQQEQQITEFLEHYATYIEIQ